MFKRFALRLLRPMTSRFYHRVNASIAAPVGSLSDRIEAIGAAAGDQLTMQGESIRELLAWRDSRAWADGAGTRENGDAETLKRYLPTLLNTISSQNASLRQVRRAELALEKSAADATDRLVAIEALLKQSADQIWQLRQQAEALGKADEDLWSGLSQTDESLAALTARVEFVRKELMLETRYGAKAEGVDDAIEPRILNQSKIDRSDQLRLNLGCGHKPLEGFINIDSRALDGVDIVAEVGRLPFENGTVDAIHSEHMLEHFPVERLRRQLLPYWHRLLKEGGSLTAIVPDAESMISAFSAGSMPWKDLRLVTFGDQEYDGDFHFTMFSAEDLQQLFSETGFTDFRVIERGRANGASLEIEVSALRSSVQWSQ